MSNVCCSLKQEYMPSTVLYILFFLHTINQINQSNHHHIYLSRNHPTDKTLSNETTKNTKKHAISFGFIAIGNNSNAGDN